MPEISTSKLEGQSNHANCTIGNLSDNHLPPFPFFKLRLELREYVYTYILVQNKQPLHLTTRPKTDTQPKNDATAILATSRRANLEARPIFLSGNAFLIHGTIADHKWLKSLGPEGQEQLREVTFLNGSQSYSTSNFRTLNTLSGCTKLSLTVRVHCRQLFSLNEMGVLKYLHGFSRADITTDLSGEERMCQEHEPGMPDWVPQAEQEYVEILGKHLVSKCPRNCTVHKARVAPVFAATVHIDCDFGCPDCYRNRFYSWAHQWQ